MEKWQLISQTRSYQPISMQKRKPIRGKTHYLQEPVRSCRLTWTSNSGPWATQEGGNRGARWKTVITVVGSSDSAPSHAARQQLNLGRSLETHSLEKLRIRSPRFWDPRWSRSPGDLGLKMEELNESISTEWWEHVPNYSPGTHSGAFYPSCL